MRKLALARVSHWDDFLISYRVYMMTGSFHILLFNGVGGAVASWLVRSSPDRVRALAGDSASLHPGV